MKRERTTCHTTAKTSQKAVEKIQTTTPETEKLSKSIKAPVSIKRTAKGGRLEIHFKTDTDLERIIKKLSQ